MLRGCLALVFLFLGRSHFGEVWCLERISSCQTVVSISLIFPIFPTPEVVVWGFSIIREGLISTKGWLSAPQPFHWKGNRSLSALRIYWPGTDCELYLLPKFSRRYKKLVQAHVTYSFSLYFKFLKKCVYLNVVSDL